MIIRETMLTKTHEHHAERESQDEYEWCNGTYLRVTCQGGGHRSGDDLFAPPQIRKSCDWKAPVGHLVPRITTNFGEYDDDSARLMTRLTGPQK